MMTVRASLLPALAVALAACVSGEGYQTPVPVPTNGPAAQYADAGWTPQEQRITHSYQAQMIPMGEYAACDLAKRELAQRSAAVCQTSFGSRTDIRALTARTQFNGGSWICNCREFGRLFMWCDVEGDAICSFEEAASGALAQ